MQLHDYRPDRAPEVADLFHRAVHAIDPAVYTPGQQEAWAPTPPDYAFWEKRLAGKKPWLAVDGECLAGFIELDPDGHIDCFYVAPEYQRRGVGRRLYEHLENRARAQGIRRLYVEASRPARAFFERQGFGVLCRNELRRHGQSLVNYSMEKRLVESESSE